MEISNEQPMEKLILETAEKIFLEKGYAMTSTTEIAKKVGCNQALVHYYYRTKENLFNVIFEQKFKIFFKEIIDFNDLQNLSFFDKLKFIIESHYDILIKNPKLPALILTELSRQPEQINILREKLRMFPERLFGILNKDMENEILQGRIRRISLIDLLISIVSLNIALFLMMPVAESVLQLTEIQKNELISRRKSENVDFILKSLRP